MLDYAQVGFRWFRCDSGCRSVKSVGIPSGKQEKGGEVGRVGKDIEQVSVQGCKVGISALGNIGPWHLIVCALVSHL